MELSLFPCIGPISRPIDTVHMYFPRTISWMFSVAAHKPGHYMTLITVVCMYTFNIHTSSYLIHDKQTYLYLFK